MRPFNKKKKLYKHTNTMEEITKKIWSCDDKEALRNGLLLCVEYLEKGDDTPDKQGLMRNVAEELAEP